MTGLKLIHVSKRGPWTFVLTWSLHEFIHMYVRMGRYQWDEPIWSAHEVVKSYSRGSHLYHHRRLWFPWGTSRVCATDKNPCLRISLWKSISNMASATENCNLDMKTLFGIDLTWNLVGKKGILHPINSWLCAYTSKPMVYCVFVYSTRMSYIEPP